MRVLAALAAAALLLTLVPTVPAAAPPGPLRIAELLAIPDSAQGQREFIELWNPTNHSVDLAGWKVRDAPTGSGAFNEYAFTTGQLAPNARIVVWSNGSADARGPSWSTSAGKTVWNDAGDAATILDPNGGVADWFAYGNAAQAPPTGFEGQAKPAAPARGLSVALDGGAWTAGSPSPGLAPGFVGGAASAQVLNVAPTVSLGSPAARAKPGQSLVLDVSAGDANGASDLATWSVTGNGASLAQGSGAPPASITLVAPATSGPWALVVTVVDAGGLSAQVSATLDVRDARLSVLVPSGVLRFPDLRPGDRNVTSLDWATLRNEGGDAVTPLLDVSPFSGPAGIPVDGHLSVGIAVGNTTTWMPYGGPLTALPMVAPGASVRMSLRIDDVPLPLVAGAYGTTFAVVPA